MSSQLTSAQSALLLQRYLEQRPNRRWDRAALAHAVEALEAPLVQTIKQPRALVKELLASGTGQERKERRAAAAINTGAARRVSRPRTAAARPTRVDAARRSTTRACRSCSRSRSPGRVSSPPRSPPAPTHPANSPGDIHPHAFLVSQSKCRQQSQPPQRRPHRQREAERQADAVLPRVSAATLARMASKAAANSGSSSARDRAPPRTVQAVPSVVSESVGESAAISPEGVESQVEGSPDDLASTVRASDAPRASAPSPWQARDSPPVRDLSAMPPAGLTSAQSDAREAMRNWLGPAPPQVVQTSRTRDSSAPRPQSQQPPAGILAPEPYRPVRPTHNDNQFSAFSHAGQEEKEQEPTRRVPRTAPPASEWEVHQASVYAESAASQRRENAHLASLNARRARPAGDVTWWPDESNAVASAAHAERSAEARRVAKFAREQRQQEMAHQLQAQWDHQREQQEQQLSQRQVERRRRSASVEPRALPRASDSPPQQARQMASSPERVSSAHYDIASASESTRAPKSPFKPLGAREAATYASTFRPAGSAAPLPHGAHEQHRYDLHHRRDSEVSEGDFSFKNHRGAMRDALRESRRQAREAAAAEMNGNDRAFEDAFEADSTQLNQSSLGQSFGGAPPALSSSLSRAHAQSAALIDAGIDRMAAAEADRARAAQLQLQLLIAAQREEETRRFLAQRRVHEERQVRLDESRVLGGQGAADFTFDHPHSVDTSIASVLGMARNPFVQAFANNASTKTTYAPPPTAAASGRFSPRASAIGARSISRSPTRDQPSVRASPLRASAFRSSSLSPSRGLGGGVAAPLASATVSSHVPREVREILEDGGATSHLVSHFTKTVHTSETTQARPDTYASLAQPALAPELTQVETNVVSHFAPGSSYRAPSEERHAMPAFSSSAGRSYVPVADAPLAAIPSAAPAPAVDVVSHFASGGVGASFSGVPASSPTRANALSRSESIARRALDSQTTRERARLVADAEYLASVRAQRAAAEARMERLTRDAIRRAEEVTKQAAVVAATPTPAVQALAHSQAQVRSHAPPSTAQAPSQSSFQPTAASIPPTYQPSRLPTQPTAAPLAQAPPTAAAFDSSALSNVSSLGHTFQFPSFAAHGRVGMPGASTGGSMTADTPSSLSSAGTPLFGASALSSALSTGATNSPRLASLAMPHAGTRAPTTNFAALTTPPFASYPVVDASEFALSSENSSDAGFVPVGSSRASVTCSSSSESESSSGSGPLGTPADLDSSLSPSERSDASVDASLTSLNTLDEAEREAASDAFFRNARVAASAAAAPAGTTSATGATTTNVRRTFEQVETWTTTTARP